MGRTRYPGRGPEEDRNPRSPGDSHGETHRTPGVAGGVLRSDGAGLADDGKSAAVDGERSFRDGDGPDGLHALRLHLIAAGLPGRLQRRTPRAGRGLGAWL